MNILRYIAVVVVAIVGARQFGYYFNRPNLTGKAVLIMVLTIALISCLVPISGRDRKSFVIDQLIMCAAMILFFVSVFLWKSA